MTTKDVFARYTDKETFAKLVDYPDVTTMWEHSVATFGDKVALIDEGKEITYSALEAEVASFRTVLISRGLHKADRVGILLKNSLDFVRSYLAVVTLGMCAAILPAHLNEVAVFGCTHAFGLKAVVFGGDLSAATSLVAERMPSVALISSGETAEEQTPSVAAGAKAHCVIMFTGGTTGKSKGVILSNEAVMQGTVNGCYGYHEVFGQRYLLVLPLSHVFGLIRNLMTSLYTGSVLIICRNNKDMFRDIAVYKPTFLVTVPALAEMALALSGQLGKNLLGPDLKYIICGAAQVAPYLVHEYAKLGISLHPGYGLTETANLVTGNVENFKKPASVGIPYPNQELKIVDGELWLKGKNLMEGYVDPKDNEAAYTDGWFRTGDLVRVDEDGFYYITGRIKEIIVLPNGENVSPAEVESYFNELDFVQDSQIFEDVDETGKHILALEIVPRAAIVAKIKDEDKAAYMTRELERVNLSLPTFMQASRIVIRQTDFPRTPSMKIERYKKC